jgi:uncharacterized protein YyaL (SSP411 family)
MIFMTAPRHTNRLIHETSPYLLQHAHNPVDWYPWGPEALKASKDLDRPIMLSIGYSACHWCHVMERESFEDEAIGQILNENFVSIKVDREERPDLDEIYMQATLIMNHGHGGWPMTVFLTPDQQPFFAGTYFPPDSRYGRPGFGELLGRIAYLWKEKKGDLEQDAQRLTGMLSDRTHEQGEQAVGDAAIVALANQLVGEFDSTYGGFGSAPKFPPSVNLQLLLRIQKRTRDPMTLEIVQKTLDGMARGGMYDHIGGGFARYSTDERWLVPHFEKMLYDNALLIKAYLEGYQVTADPYYRQVATQTLDYVLREMTSPEGGFYSATDADSEGEEGKFFVWNPRQVEEVLGAEEAKKWCAYYDITLRGNWEGKSIPNTPRSSEEVARELSITPEALIQSLEKARPLMYAARAKRVPPGLDDKVLTAWNGLMISAMAEGHRVLGDKRYLEGGERAARFLLSTLSTSGGRLLRTYRAGKAHLNAYLEDYAYVASALIDLHEAGGGRQFLLEANRLVEILLSEFVDADGAFFTTGTDHEALIVRHRSGTDGAIPNGSSVAAFALARLSVHLDKNTLADAATRAIRARGQMIAQHPRAFGMALLVVDFLRDGPLEIVLVGEPGAADTEEMWRAIGTPFVPSRIITHRRPGEAETGEPLTAGKGALSGRATVYICRNYACQQPLTDPKDVLKALAS